MPPGHGVARPVNNDTVNVAGVLVAGHGDMQRQIGLAAAIPETMKVGGGLMTQHALRSRPDQGRPSQRIIAGRPGEGSVDPPMKVLPPPSPEERIDRSRMQPMVNGLSASNDATLQRDKRGASIRNVNAHAFIVPPPHQASESIIAPVENAHPCG